MNQNELIFVFANESALRNFIQQGGSSAGKATCRRSPKARVRPMAERRRYRLASICFS